MHVLRLVLVTAALGLFAGCGSSTSDRAAPDVDPLPAPPAGAAPAPTDAAPAACEPSACPPPSTSPAPVAPLQVRFLGVQGFLVGTADEAILTAPLFTRPDMITVTTGLPVTSDEALVEANLPTSMLGSVRAVLSGHAHYDHLLDVPSVMARAPQATLYSNTSSQRLLDAYAPDRGPACEGSPVQAISIARSRVVALDDPAASAVDYTNCPDKRPPGVPLTGRWVPVPGSHIRIYAVCSEHPDQIGPIHFAPGEVETEQCVPPTRADAWKEGPTLAFLVDFLDAAGAPLYRIYYQDAPSHTPVGHVPAPVLAGKPIDLALLCVGSSDHVPDAPQNTISALAPRYVLGGHWEDFFTPASAAPQPLPFLDVAGWLERAQAAMPEPLEPETMLRNGTVEPQRAVVPNPGDTFVIAR
jgi:L-ascorbate metabolism protein UlaG (beta-lactamase superfamily)